MYKTIIQTLLAGFYAILAASPLEGGGVMIAARQIAFGSVKRGLSAKDYIQDGLVAMWDGIENAGWGVHDASATVWKDLSGEWGDATQISSRAVWTDNALSGTSGNGYLARGTGDSKTSDDIVTFECVFLSPEDQQQRIFCPRTVKKQKIVQYLGTAGNNSIRVFAPYGPSNLASAPNLGRTKGIRLTASLIYDDENTTNAKASFKNGAQIYEEREYGCVAGGVSGWFDIGGRADGHAWTTFCGEINCLRIYDRELTAEEIAHNYEIDKARFEL
jgi:hypothetical protein